MEKSDKGVPFSGRYTGSSSFDLRFIKKVVQEIEEGLPVLAALAEYGLSRSTLRDWLNKYGSPAYLKRRKKKISPQIKRSVVRAVSSGKMTVREAGAFQGVGDRAIRVWLTDYKAENAELADSNLCELTKKKTPQPVPPPDAINPDIKALQAQLDYATLKIAALNTLIDVAEEQLKIDIRKKPGTRQL